MKNNQNKIGFYILLIISIILVVSIMLKLSFVIIYKNAQFNNVISLLFENVDPQEFKYCFHPYSLFVLGIYLIILAKYYYNKLKPKATAKWRNIEQGSNEFQTEEEKQEFLEKCTDEVINFTEEEIKAVLSFIEGVKDVK